MLVLFGAVMRYASRNTAIIRDLCPAAQERCDLLIQRLEAAGIDVLFTSGLRSIQEQNALYAKGRTKKGNIVTYVKGEDSEHVYGVAIDLVPIDQDGNERYDDFDAYKRVNTIAGQLGFVWGYERWGFDMPHFSYLGGLRLLDLKRGLLPTPIPRPPSRNQVEREVARLQNIAKKQSPERRLGINLRISALKKALARLE